MNQSPKTHREIQQNSLILKITMSAQNNQEQIDEPENDVPNTQPESKIIQKLREERELSKKSLVEIEQKWKAILTDEKLSSLKHDFHNLIESYKGEIRRKDEMIHQLVRRHEEGEDMHRTAIASHLQVIDGMIHVDDNQLAAIEVKFHDSIRDLRTTYRTERKHIEERYEIDKIQLMNEIAEYEQSEKRLAEKGTRDEQEELEEIRNKNLEDINSLRFILDTKIEDLDEQFELAKNEFFQKTDLQSESLEQKRSKDEEMMEEMAVLQTKTDNLSLAMKQLKRIAHRKSMQNTDRNQQLMRRKSEIISRYKNTKAKMDDLRMIQHKKLKDLTMRASGQKTDLENVLSQADKILKLMKLISKLEIQQDRSGEDSIDWSKTPLDVNAIIARYNEVLLNYEQVKVEKEHVLEENRMLKNKIQKFRDGITVNERVMLSSNPLLVINGKMRPDSRSSFSSSSESNQAPKEYRRLTVVDANHAFAMSHAR